MNIDRIFSILNMHACFSLQQDGGKDDLVHELIFLRKILVPSNLFLLDFSRLKFRDFFD